VPEYLEKLRIPVRISLTGEDPLDGDLSLAPISEAHDGPESVLDILNAPARFVPFTRSDDQTCLLLSRTNINWVVTGPGVDPQRVCPANFMVMREESVHVTFTDGRGIDGLIQMELPEGMNRASDFLNCPEEFFALRSRLGVVLVNKQRVRDVLVLEPSPKPIALDR
jgi:hypothetical protein